MTVNATADEPALPVRPLLGHDPESFGRYRLLARLGSGGMGTVFLARSDGGRTVALKAVHRDLAEEKEFRERFRQELQVARSLGGADFFPSVVDADTAGPRPWLASEYLLGPSLSQAVEAHGPWPYAALRALGVALARGLATVHHQGLVHRDLKPSNVLITADGPKLIDFGLARAVGAERLTRTGRQMGTPAYISPEQARPVGGQSVGPPADVFALGGLLVYAATGRAPFGEGGANDVLYRVAYAEPDLAGVPEELWPLVVGCLAKDPADRPAADRIARTLAGTGTGTGEDGGREGEREAQRVGEHARQGEGEHERFAGLLPAGVLHDIALRTATVWDVAVRRPEESQAPPPATDPEAPPAQDGPRPVRRRLVLGGLGAMAAAGVAGGVWWAAAGPGDDDTPSEPRTGPGATGPDTAPQPLWEYRGPIGDLGTPLLYRGVIAVQADPGDGILGVDARRGTLRWTAPAVSGYTPMACGGLLAMKATYADGDDRLAMVDPADGRTWYSDPLGVTFRFTDHPVSAGDARTAYVIGHSGAHRDGSPDTRGRYLLAYDTMARKVRWRRDLGRGSATHLPGMVAGGRLVLVDAGSVTAYDTADGRRRWRVELPGDDDVVAGDGSDMVPRWTAAVARGTVLMSGPGLRTIDLRTGRGGWRLDPDELPSSGSSYGPAFGAPAVADGVAYLTVLGTHVFAIDLASHHVRWKWKADTDLASPPARPMVADGLVFPPSSDIRASAVAVDRRTGRTRWTLRDSSGSVLGTTQPLVGQGRLYVARGKSIRALPLT
ncbi:MULTISPECIES: serine/threonine-protein kinase [unclassified Streptomyces]|uniref:serine/threonine-protein kinase n=1 Tax=unclassified Streptomyces TaxID=2593676 RepID=UPI00336A4DC3